MQLLTDKKTNPRREFISHDPFNESVNDAEKHRGGDMMVQLTAGNDPADLGTRNLEEDSERCDPGIGV